MVSVQGLVRRLKVGVGKDCGRHTGVDANGSGGNEGAAIEAKLRALQVNDTCGRSSRIKVDIANRETGASTGDGEGRGTVADSDGVATVVIRRRFTNNGETTAGDGEGFIVRSCLDKNGGNSVGRCVGDSSGDGSEGGRAGSVNSDGGALSLLVCLLQ